MDSLNITVVAGSLGGGGAERIVLWLAEQLTRVGHKLTILTLHDDGTDFYDVPMAVRRVKAPEVVSKSYRWFDWRGQLRSSNQLRSLILGTAPDIVVTFIDSINVRVLQALGNNSLPVIVSEQTDWRFHKISWRWRIFRRLYYPRAKGVVVLSSDLYHFGLNRRPSWNLVHIANPVPKINVPAIAKPKWFGSKTIIAMGRLVPEKGFDLLLKAFKLIASTHKDWKLVILGEGAERKTLLHLADNLELNDRVTMPGAYRCPFGLLQLADVFVFSSRYEGFGLALAEAMAVGLPVITFNCPSGPADIVRDDVDGLLVPPGDVPALAVAMDKLISDPELRQRLARRAPDVCERFAPELIRDQWIKLIEEAVALKKNGVELS